ncbi:metallophosphoesterase [Acetonema longum]|uniref:Metallophosphoesterase n=1 Tax=Acetonema longum DSM 6540 TaxID=1009370 RepID=F7NHA4_9FIRM|nr:metallophosphoesterase [Acetonema longum]EGO64587.1 metallophosphoesterase [Acetonema longum DSM 6540]
MFFLVFFAVYGGANLYVGMRAWQAFGYLLPAGPVKFFFFLYGLLAVSYFIAHAGYHHLPRTLTDPLHTAGAYWFAILYYAFFFVIIVDIIRLLDRFFSFIPASLKKDPAIAGFFLAAVLATLIIYGVYNARQPVVRPYTITIQKTLPSAPTLRVAVMSDLHLGELIGRQRLEGWIDTAAALKPDLVLLTGDILDANVEPFIEERMGEAFRRLQPKYGIYGVIGNHEYIGGTPSTAVRELEKAGITVLVDRYVQTAGLYIVGRDDYSRSRYDGSPRQPLSRVMAGIDPAAPVILLDHQPYNLAEALANKADLQLSGHTHRGQFFPNNLITQRVFEIDWGYLKKETLQVIVSCGVGTWGPPIRIGNQPEILDLTIHFEQP